MDSVFTLNTLKNYISLNEPLGEELYGEYFPHYFYPQCDEGWPGEAMDFPIHFPTKEDPIMGSFKMDWCFGANRETSVYPLKNGNVFYSTSHMGIIYNNEENTMETLQGHKNQISCLAECGKFLVTADEGPKTSVVILWDSNTFVPLKTWIQPQPGTRLLSVTENGECIFTLILQQLPIVRRFDLENNIEAKGVINLQGDRPLHLTTVIHNINHCVITFPKKIVIMTGDYSIIKPQESTAAMSNKRVSTFRRSCTIHRENQILTGTSSGQLIVWTQNGKFIKMVQLTKADITWLQLTNDTLVVAFSNGILSLYGQDLRLKSFCNQSLGVIKSMSPNKDRTSSVLEFTIFTSTGMIASISRSGEVNCLNRGGGIILSMDCKPELPYVCTGDDQGQVTLYNIEYKTIELVRNIRSKTGITAIKFSSDGNLLSVGSQIGELLLLDPTTLQIKGELTPARASIKEICFSQNSKYLAYYHEANGVGLYKHLLGWTFKGKYRGHCKTVTGMAFGSTYLYTIGEDQCLVQYDVRSDLRVMSTTRIELTAYPTSIVCYDDELLVANSEMKIRVIESETKEIVRTIQGPEQEPINIMRVQDHSLIYAAGEYIGECTLPDFSWKCLTIAHPQRISKLVVCGKVICTTERNNAALIIWTLKNTSPVPFKVLPHFINERICQIFDAGPISASDLANHFRFLGYFPTDFEIGNVMREIQKDEVTEDEFKVLFNNHKPVHMTTMCDIKKALSHVCEYAHSNVPIVIIERLTKALEHCEEPITEEKVVQCLNILVKPAVLPRQIPLDEFITEILGISANLVD